MPKRDKTLAKVLAYMIALPKDAACVRYLYHLVFIRPARLPIGVAILRSIDRSVSLYPALGPHTRVPFIFVTYVYIYLSGSSTPG